MADMPWREAVITVLKEESSSLHYTAIAERIVEDGLRTAVGATPTSTVVATITTSIKNEGEDSPFRRVGRGIYILRDILDTHPPETSSGVNDSAEKFGGVFPCPQKNGFRLSHLPYDDFKLPVGDVYKMKRRGDF